MKRALLIGILMTAACTLSFAQNEISNKLSISTQMFLDERDGKIDISEQTSTSKGGMTNAIIGKWDKRKKNDKRFYASPDTLEGKAYISTFLRLDDSNSVGSLEAKGVILQCSFDNGLVTALVPVDSIESVAGLSSVRRINVASLMQPMTDKARSATNVDDALSLSTEAIASGLSAKYDGTGVVLGVIDTGIDFQHIAFKDANGNSRIKRAYVYNGSSAKEYTNISSNSPTTDDKTNDHGTHTSTTAGGSSVKVNGNNVSVTNDHANATYGGMAPGADLYLAAINGLSSTYLANALKKICDYADGVGKPVVISNSWGSQFGPHDGTGDFADITAQYFNDSKPNHICLFAASNDGGKSKDNEGGGYHLSGTASSSKPLGSILRSATYINTDAGYYYYGVIANAWARSSSVGSMACKIFVLDSSTGAVKTSVTVNPTTSGATVSGLSSYFKGTLVAYKDYISSNKTQILLYTNGLTSQSTTTTTKNGESYYVSKYTLAVQFYPTSGSSTIDVWGGTYGYFTNHLTTSGYTWTNGSDDMCVSDEATDPNVISIGAYVTSNTTTDYQNHTTDFSSEYTIGDIAYFSSFATASQSPTGKQYPWICAPGARIVAGVNHYHTASVDEYSYYGSDFSSDLVVNSSSNPYAAMEGTSMATPVAAGIVALWLQAATETGKTLTTSQVKEIMKETAIHDAFTTTGANASHFGNGKIDALAGICSIVGATSLPRITATTNELNFETSLLKPVTKTFDVRGFDLSDPLSISVLGDDFSADITHITTADAAAGTTVAITFCPTTAGTKTGIVTLSSSEAEPVTISLTGIVHAPLISTSTPLVAFDDCFATLTYSQSVTVGGQYLLDGIAVSLADDSGMFSIALDTIPHANGSASAEVTVTYAPTDAGTHQATLILSSPSAEAVTVTLSGTAAAATPRLDVSNTTLTFSTHVDEVAKQTFHVSGMFIDDEVTVNLSDDNGVFSVNPSSLSPSQIAAGATITVSFLAADEGTFTGSVLLTSGDTSATVMLSAEANDGGTAEDPFLNIRKHATISHTGWTNYKYTAYPNDGTALLTFAAYDAYTNDDSQRWYSMGSVSTTSTSWNASAPFLGSCASATTRAVNTSGSIWGGTGATTLTFYVTACTEVTICGKNGSGSSFSSVKTSLSAYACTLDADGTPTAASAAAKTATSTTKNSAVTLRCNGLDASTVYKVVVTLTRATLYEIALQTPLPTPVIHADPQQITLTSTAGTPATAAFTVRGSHLRDDINVSLSDDSGTFSVDTTRVTTADAAAGMPVSVTFNPTAEGTYSCLLTLSSTDAETVTVALTGTAVAPATAVVGDTNGDGVLNVSDVTLMVRHILSTEGDGDSPCLSLQQMDVNGDGVVDVADVTQLVALILGSSTDSE